MRFRSLRARSVLLIVLIYAAVGVPAVAAFVLAARGVIDGIGRRFAAESARQSTGRILGPVQREMALARKLADSALLQEWCRHEDDPAVRDRALAELESYRRAFADHSYFFVHNSTRHYYFNDAADQFRGRELRYTLREQDPSMAWYFASMRTVDDFALHVDSSEQLGIFKLWINVIVKDGGRKVGMGGTGLELSRFVKAVVESGVKGVTTVLVDRGGYLQAHPNPRYMEFNARMKDESQRMTLYQLMGDGVERDRVRGWLRRLSAGESEMETGYLTVEGRRQMAAATYMKEIDWAAVVLLDPAEVIGARAFVPFLVILALGLLLTFALVSASMNRLVLAPIARLTLSTQRISAGDYSISLPVDREDEIGRLTTSFNDMTATVRDHLANLEQKVRQRTEDLSEANRRLTESNAKIMDSIRYASLIQTSLLPAPTLMRRHLPDHFLIYRPRDIVGGDFYALVPDARGLLLAVADCTGHGVPGAFMTMSARAVLDQLLAKLGPDDPARLLAEMNRAMRAALLQADGPRRHDRLDNGLDMAIVRVLPAERRMVFAGARIPLWTSGRDAGIIETAGDRHSLGYRRSDPSHSFASKEIEMSPGSAYYLFTDGILDQAGGEHGFGLGRRRLTEALRQVLDRPMAEQGEAVERLLARHQGARQQRDDITVIGFRIDAVPRQE